MCSYSLAEICNGLNLTNNILYSEAPRHLVSCEAGSSTESQLLLQVTIATAMVEHYNFIEILK